LDTKADFGRIWAVFPAIWRICRFWTAIFRQNVRYIVYPLRLRFGGKRCRRQQSTGVCPCSSHLSSNFVHFS
jgi:hypothetical protein